MNEGNDGASQSTGSAQPRQLHFLGGLPRSGSTLLSNILMQNPAFHVTATSGLEALLQDVRLHWDQAVEFRAMPTEESERVKLQVLRHMVQGYFAHIEQPVILDKSRGWTGSIPFIEKILSRKARIVAPVRDVRAVLASFEKLRQRQPLKSLQGEPKDDAVSWSSLEGRCRKLFSDTSPVGTPYRRIRDALRRGFGDRIHFVDFDDLTADPAQTLNGIYDFLGLPHFEHDFDHVEQKTTENDDVFQMPGLHTIRSKVEPAGDDWSAYIPPEVARHFPGKELWASHKR